METAVDKADSSPKTNPSSLAQVPPSPPVSKDDLPIKLVIGAGDFRIDQSSVRQKEPVLEPLSDSSAVTWYPQGKAATIAGVMVADGMIYVGRANEFVNRNGASFIDPALHVASNSKSATPPDYWPSYRRLTPESRRYYLEWLASGKQEPDADIGYVFLYFYGLERRLLLDAPESEEVQQLIVELNRLRTIYTHNSAFDDYSDRLLEAVAFQQNALAISQSSFVPDLSAESSNGMSFPLKLAIAHEVIAGRPLNFELAAAALFGLREFRSTHGDLPDKGRSAFLDVLRPRFEAAFRSGFPLRNRKDSRLKFVYHGASAGLAVDLTERVGVKDLPDPESLTWTKLLTLADTVVQEISPYVKTLTYHPERANALYGLISCPAELRDTVALEDQRWLESLASPVAAVPFGELAGHAIGNTTAKWTIRHQRQISEALAAVGYAMEPDPEDGPQKLEDGTLVQVFRCVDRTRSHVMDVAGVAAMLVAFVVRTVGDNVDKIADIWLSSIPSRLSLSDDQTARLRARLAWLITTNVTLAKAKRLLGDADQEDREFCAWSATVATGAVGAVGKAEIVVLEAIYDALSVSRSALYSGLHAGIGAATAATDEPILVSDAVLETSYPIPPPPAAAQAEDVSDRLARVRAETESATAVLSEIFIDEEPLEATPEPANEGRLSGLDREHTALLIRLLTRSEWRREEFDRAAIEAGLMPGGAMETINEWAFDHHDDALLEDADPVMVNRALLPIFPETAASE